MWSESAKYIPWVHHAKLVFTLPYSNKSIYRHDMGVYKTPILKYKEMKSPLDICVSSIQLLDMWLQVVNAQTTYKL